MERIVHSLEELEQEARSFFATLTPHVEKATLVALSGELGAGKTAFTKAVAKELGIDETVNSPTFVLEKIYTLSAEKAFKRLVHIDAYRLEAERDLAALGFDELMKDSGNLVFLEWPEKVFTQIPEGAIRISIAAHDDSSRTISYA